MLLARPQTIIPRGVNGCGYLNPLVDMIRHRSRVDPGWWCTRMPLVIPFLWPRSSRVGGLSLKRVRWCGLLFLFGSFGRCFGNVGLLKKYGFFSLKLVICYKYSSWTVFLLCMLFDVRLVAFFMKYAKNLVYFVKINSYIGV